MNQSRLAICIALAALVLFIGGTGVYFLGFSGEGKVPSQPVVTTLQTPAMDAVDQAPEATGQAEPSPAETPGVVMGPHSSESSEQRPNLEARRAARFEAYSKLPAQERARILAQRWGLSEEQEKDIAEIMARYSEALAALAQQNLSDAERARTQQQMQRQQMQEIAPIVGESPGIRSAMQRFIAAAEARGGKLVKPESQ